MFDATEVGGELREGTGEGIEETREDAAVDVELGESVAAVEAETDCFEVSGAVPAVALVATPAPAYSLVQYATFPSMVADTTSPTARLT